MPPRTLKRNLIPLAIAGIVAAAVVIPHIGGSSDTVSRGLPRTPDYHSLLVDPRDSNRLTLGTHIGLFHSADGGRTWVRAELRGDDAMNIARAGGSTLWAAGHNVLARSTDGGATWAGVDPSGLPSLDVHGFAVDPTHPLTVYAAIAGQGFYRSTDGGRTYALRSSDVGPGVMAVAVLTDGRVLAGDLQRQEIVESLDGGTTWKAVARASIRGLAADARGGGRILAAGPGVLLSKNGGKTWRQVLRIDGGAGPIAWAPTDPRRAYVVGFDRVLYATQDAGETWHAVAGAESG